MAPDTSQYLDHLPEIFRGAPAGAAPFLGRFLKIFEALLSGRADSALGGDRVEGVEEVISRFADYLDPGLVPVDDAAASPLDSAFLTYLASWVALEFDQNWDLGKKREWLRHIVPLYKRRGTKEGLTAYLATFIGDQVEIDEPPGGFEIAATSTVGVDTFIAGAPAYFFRVLVHYAFDSSFDVGEWKNVRRGTRAIVDLEKPAHTYYTLDARTPGFIVAQRSTIGRDTLLWRRSRRVRG